MENADTLPSTFSSFLIKYRLFLTLGIPIVFVGLSLWFFFSPNENGGLLPEPTPSIAATNKPTPAKNVIISPSEESPKYNIEQDLKGIQKIETLPDGTNRYFLASANPTRPNIVIADSEGVVIFKRSVTSTENNLALSGFIDTYGKPKWIFKGSVFYGSAYQAYIYPDLGFALVINPETGSVVEEHVFDPVSIEDYVKKYGDDIPSQP